jgi:hypothetical protein
VQQRKGLLDPVVQPGAEQVQAAIIFQRLVDASREIFHPGPFTERSSPHVVTTAGGRGKDENFQNLSFGITRWPRP